MSSIEKVGKAWRVRWREGGRGSPMLSSKRFDEKGDAVEFQRQLGARMEALRAPTGLALTGRELAEKWRLHLASTGKTAGYVEHAPDRVIDALGDTMLSRLTRDALRAQGLGRRRVVQAALRWGKNELGAAIPEACLKLPISSPPRQVRPDLMPDDVFAKIQAAADAISKHMGVIVHLVGNYGHRPESLSKMRPEDIEEVPPRLRLTVKGGDHIRHPIAVETLARLTAAPPPFIDPGTGKPFLSGWDIARVYRSCLGRSRWKDEPGIYSLKRRAISGMLGKGLDPATIASITGHRRPDVLLRHYARTNEARQEAALGAIFSDVAGKHAGSIADAKPARKPGSKKRDTEGTRERNKRQAAAKSGS